MHSTIVASRRATALKSLVLLSQALVERLKLDPALLEGFSPVGVREQAVRDMMALESASKIVEQFAFMSGAIDQPVTTVTTESTSSTTDPDVVIAEMTPKVDDLPAPVMDNAPTEDVIGMPVSENKEPAKKRKTKGT